MSTSPDVHSTVHDRSDEQITGLYRGVARAMSAVAGQHLPAEQIPSTRAIIAQTLRWAAGQLGNSTATIMRLGRWAEQVDELGPCHGCRGLYPAEQRERHFADVAHDWDRIPRDLRGLPERGGCHASH
jgi:hypothetical protein